MDVKLVVQRNGQPAQTINLRSSEMIIGRQKGCGVRVPSGQVSRQHCVLAIKEDLLSVEDLSSANGTFINGRRITKREFLRPGDLLKVGPVTMLVQYQLTQAAVGRLLKGDEEELVVVPLDDVEVLPVPQDEEVELVLEPDDDAPLLIDDPIDALDAPTAADPLEALRAIEAKGSGVPTPRPVKKKTSDLPKQRTPAPPPPDEEPEAPPKRIKLADAKKPVAPAASIEPEEETEDEPSPDASQILGHKNWQLPTGEDIRDILAQIEKGKKKT